MYGGGAAGKLRVVEKGLDGGGVFDFFWQDEIDAYADDGGGFALVADGFDQDAAEFVPAGDQIVRPLDLYVQTRCVQGAAAGECDGGGERAEFVLRFVEYPAEAEHQAFAQPVCPLASLPPAAFGLQMRDAERFMGLFGRSARQIQDFVVAGRAFMF